MIPDAKENRVLAALSYVFLLFLLPLAKKNSPFCQFHAKQGLVLFIAWIPVSFIAMIPLIGWIAWLSLLIIDLMAISKTLNGEMWELPWLGKYAKQIKL